MTEAAPVQTAVANHVLLESAHMARTMELSTWEDILKEHSVHPETLQAVDKLGNGVGHILVEKVANINLLHAALREGVDFSMARKDQAAPIHLAANRGDMLAEQIVRWLHQHVREDCNRPRPGGLRPLDIAGHGWRHAGLISSLVTNGAQVNSRHAARQWTPLHMAARLSYNHEILIRLLRHGADPDLVEIDGLKPLDLVRVNRNLMPSDRGVVLLEDNTYQPRSRYVSRIRRPRRLGLPEDMKKGRRTYK